MTDREMLEMAAKAAGVELRWYPDGTAFSDARCSGYWGVWNPLAYDGDAQWLAVACQLGISIVGGLAGIVECVSFKECHCFVSSREIADDGDLCAATRLAIVRAAAQIGAQM